MFIHRSTWQWIFPAQSSNKDFVFDGEFFLGKNSSFLAGGHSSWPRHDTAAPSDVVRDAVLDTPTPHDQESNNEAHPLPS